jgi:glycosyltransferase involved in cell wall biosynthesis
MKNPIVTVITVVYNSASVIERTIQSVLRQRAELHEYIVIDGNSTDGTQALIEKYRENIDVYLSEMDRGIPHALNKAVALASGKYVIFILGGDTLTHIPYEYLKVEQADLVCFPVMVTGDKIQYPKLGSRLKIMNTIPHQGAFFKKTEYLIHNENYRYYCDFALCQLYFINNRSIKIYDNPVVAFHGLDGATSNKNNFKEVFKIVRDNYGVSYQLLSYLYFKYDGLKRRLRLNKEKSS